MPFNSGLTVGIAPSRAWLQICKPLLEPALARDPDSSWADLEHDYAIDHAQLWIVFTDELLAACVTRLLINENTTELWLCGGKNAKEWTAALVDRIQDWAIAESCPHLRLNGRIGWVKELPDWKITQRNGKFVRLDRRHE